MIINKTTKHFMSRTDKPNKNWINNTEVFIVKDGTDLAKKIEDYAPYCDFVLDVDGNLIDIIPIEKPPESPKVPTPEERISALEETTNYLLGL